MSKVEWTKPLRQIEFVEEGPTKLGTEDYYAGDVKTFPTPLANVCINEGWAKCSETGDIGERTLTPTAISPDDLISTVGAS